MLKKTSIIFLIWLLKGNLFSSVAVSGNNPVEIGGHKSLHQLKPKTFLTPLLSVLGLFLLFFAIRQIMSSKDSQGSTDPNTQQLPVTPTSPAPQSPTPQPPVAPTTPAPQSPTPQPPVAPTTPAPQSPTPQPPVAPTSPAANSSTSSIPQVDPNISTPTFNPSIQPTPMVIDPSLNTSGPMTSAPNGNGSSRIISKQESDEKTKKESLIEGINNLFNTLISHEFQTIFKNLTEDKALIKLDFTKQNSIKIMGDFNSNLKGFTGLEIIKSTDDLIIRFIKDSITKKNDTSDLFQQIENYFFSFIANLNFSTENLPLQSLSEINLEKLNDFLKKVTTYPQETQNLQTRSKTRTNAPLIDTEQKIQREVEIQRELEIQRQEEERKGQGTKVPTAAMKPSTIEPTAMKPTVIEQSNIRQNTVKSTRETKLPRSRSTTQKK